MVLCRSLICKCRSRPAPKACEALAVRLHLAIGDLRTDRRTKYDIRVGPVETGAEPKATATGGSGPSKRTAGSTEAGVI